jgi:hypothetical protein
MPEQQVKGLEVATEACLLWPLSRSFNRSLIAGAWLALMTPLTLSGSRELIVSVA